MIKTLKENILFLCICGIAALFGFALICYVFAADTVRTEIISASPLRTHTYEVEQRLSEDDPTYDPAYHRTKTTHATKYHRTVTFAVDGETGELELSGEFGFLLPGEGRKITVSRDVYGGYYWEHPLRNLIMGAVLCFGGSAGIVSTFRSGKAKKKASGTKKRKKALS